MDVFFGCPISFRNEDLSGVLRTIILFLENLKLGKTCEVLRNECANLGVDVSLEIKGKNEKNIILSNEKVAGSSIFEASETLTSNSVNFYYTNAPDFKNDSEKSLARPNDTKNFKKSAGTCHPIYTNIGVQYDDSDFNSKTTKVHYNALGICNIPAQHGAGEDKVTLDNSKEWTCDETIKKFKALQVEHSKLITVTTELVKALQMGITGQSERFYHLREKCKEIYPDLFILMENNDKIIAPTNDRNKTKVCYDVFYLTAEERKTSQIKLEAKRSMSDTCLDKNKNFVEYKLEKKESSKSLENIMLDDKSLSTGDGNPNEKGDSNENSTFFNIDYDKLKNDLFNADDGTKMLILQALRWRITRQSSEVRKTVMASYIKYDLLCLEAPRHDKLVLLESLYCPKNSGIQNPLQECIARFINTFASLSVGRDYLSQHDNLLTQLLLPLILEKHHTSTKLSNIAKDMVLATLQKLSLRFHARQQMIALGLTEFLINFLNENHANITIYCLEYSTALIMNLCLHKEGRSRCTAKSRDVIKLIKKLLSSKYAQSIMPYVNGTMYSLLGNRKINAEAKLMDLASILRHHIKQTNGDNKKQLEIILKIHLEGGTIKHPDPKIEGEELDLIEPELEENDPIRGDICGEQVLANYKFEENESGNNPFPNVPTIPRPRSAVSLRTENSAKDHLKCPHPSKCTTMFTDQMTKQENVGAEPLSTLEQPASPAESFSEVTKQFYHRPSMKRGIFDRRKLKIPKHPYQTKLVNIPSEKSSEHNDANFVCGCVYKTCECDHQNTSKYTCCCYDAMKAFVENTNIKSKSDSCCQTSPKTTNDCSATLHKDDFSVRNNKKCDNNGLNKLCNVKLEVQTEESCNKPYNLDEGENYCKCYNVIFQSRPRIVRTPP